VQLVEFSEVNSEPVALYRSLSASSVAVAQGSGESHVYFVHFAAAGEIGAHVTGSCQLFVPIVGSGWAAGGDGVRVGINPGQAAFFERGELHSKGSEGGMLALMVQSAHFQLVSSAIGVQSDATDST
jgi:hypothetical protein